ncbi:MAG: sigma-70 family RNA polymerase sigma factor [Planctomycetota bacterium]
MLTGPAGFTTTRWSLVRRAASREGTPSAPGNETEGTRDPARAALDSLCRTYWPAVVAYLRRHGHDRDAARDLAQAFFARLLEKDWLARADEARGSFRAFLATLLRRFVANQLEAENALVRGGGERHVPITFDSDAPGTEPVAALTPEQSFDRAWIHALLDEVRRQLREEYAAAGLATRFSRLEPYLVPDATRPPFAAMARDMGLVESSCRVAVFRARRRFRDLLRDAIAGTVNGREDVEAELDAFLMSLSNNAP